MGNALKKSIEPFLKFSEKCSNQKLCQVYHGSEIEKKSLSWGQENQERKHKPTKLSWLLQNITSMRIFVYFGVISLE